MIRFQKNVVNKFGITNLIVFCKNPRFKKEKIMKKNLVSAAFFAAFSVFPSFSISGVLLKNPLVGEGGSLLALADVSGSKTNEYTALIGADASSGKSSILTCFPERIDVLSGGKVVQIRNSFGTALCDVSSSELRWIKNEESFVCQSSPQVVSSDGKWCAFIRRTTPGKGELLIERADTKESRVIDLEANFSYRDVPAKWSPDGAILLYEKQGSVYFCEPEALFSGIQIEEQYRRLGDGSMKTFSWATSREIVRVSGDIIYKIDVKQLHTRTLYQPLVGSGVALCRLSVPFDEKRDKFWASPDGSSFAMLSSGSIFSIYRRKINSDSFVLSTVLNVDEIRSSLSCDVLWSDGVPILWISSESGSTLYRLGSFADEILSSDCAVLPKISPNGRKIAIASGKSIFIRDFKTLKILGKLDGERVLSFAWSGNDTLFVGGESSVREWNLLNSTVRTLFLSSVKDALWRGGVILAQTNNDRFFEVLQKDGATIFRKVDFDFADFSMQKRQIQNGLYRAYVGEDGATLFVRDLSGHGKTSQLWSAKSSRSSGGKVVHLVFDALDSAEGIDWILSVLDEYKIRATFFLNGEFIRRYPKETKKIAQSKNVCASMFFASVDLEKLSCSGYVVDEEFVRRGLSRNEDEFFATTGKELALLWHTPFYSADKKIREFGKKSAYKYVDALSLDSTTFESIKAGTSYWSTSQIISALAKNPPDVIPVSVGRPHGTRSDFLWERLDILIDELINAGYEFDIIE